MPLFIIALSLITTLVHADITGIVTKIIDGDTLTVTTAANEPVKVRLQCLDAPERKQPYGQKSNAALAELTAGKAVTVVSSGTDRYGRTIGRVFVDDTDINATLIKNGTAWVYRQYCDDNELLKMEQSARQRGVGFWADESPMPPWEWRKMKKQGLIE